MSDATNDERLRRGLVAHLERLQQDGVWGLSVPDTVRFVPSAGAGATPEPASGFAADPVSADAARAMPDGPEPAAGDRSDRPESAAGGGGGSAVSVPALDAVEVEALGCVACRLHETRTKVVFGVGDPHARLMFIGEGPGRDEDLQGEPFVGRAGQLLNRIIKAMGYEREEVYIANAVKCRPPQNRDPQADEVAACRHFLMRQVDLVAPEIIVLLGRSAVGAVLDLSAPLSRLRGSFREWNGVKVMCTYHPAYLLRNSGAKGMVWEDMKLVRDALAGTAGEP